MFPSNRSQTNNLDHKSMNWFLCDGSIEGQANLTLTEHSPEFKEKKFRHNLKMTVGFSDLLLTFSISQQF